MNVFFTDYDPIQCAYDHCKTHTRKMIIEYAQMLSTTHRILNPSYADANNLYKTTHENHPSTKWVRESTEHYTWLFQVFEQLCWIYQNTTGKEHKTSRLISALSEVPATLPHRPFQVPPMAMPDEYKRENTVEAYRGYVISKYVNWTTRTDKKRMKVEWYAQQPDWTTGAL